MPPPSGSWVYSSSKTKPDGNLIHQANLISGCVITLHLTVVHKQHNWSFNMGDRALVGEEHPSHGSLFRSLSIDGSSV